MTFAITKKLEKQLQKEQEKPKQEKSKQQQEESSDKDSDDDHNWGDDDEDEACDDKLFDGEGLEDERIAPSSAAFSGWADSVPKNQFTVEENDDIEEQMGGLQA